MKKQLLLLAITGLMLSGYAGAADKSAPQQRRIDCNQQASAKSLKGEQLKNFMEICLQKESDMVTLTPQQIKMKTCNAHAGEKDLKGDERKAFLSNCLQSD